MLDLGVTLIPVPYWWDRSHESLAPFIRSHRPDITVVATSQFKEIPATPPRVIVRLKPLRLNAAFPLQSMWDLWGKS